jgi:hypothetical protein
MTRCFSLFPNPGLSWRFIKIDNQNISGIFPEAAGKKDPSDSAFDHAQKCFFKVFNFKNRDAMASKNMLTIAKAVWGGQDHPDIFKQQSATSKVVVKSSH